MSEGDSHAATTDADARETTEILRFRLSERHLHWAIAVPFLICYATAVVLVTIYNPDPTRPFRAVFSWIHRLSGVALCAAPILTLLRHRHDMSVHLGNTRVAWRWRFDDIRWLLLMGPATVDKRIALPHQEKFNAAEKINFMVLTATWPLYIVTGILIWMPGVAYLSWLVHLSMAAAATPLIAGHIFMATVNPDTRVGLSGMITGYVDRHWAHHHYRHWFDETFPHLAHTAPTDVTKTPPLEPVAVLGPVAVLEPVAAFEPVAVLEPVAAFEPETIEMEDESSGLSGPELQPFLGSPSGNEPVQDAA